MKNYYIYHIAGIKIGCTINVPKRMKQQGFTEWEHLETHTDIYEASDREIELQKEYGLPVDIVPYWKSVLHRYKWDSNTAKEAAANSSSKEKLQKTTFEQAEKIRSEYINSGDGNHDGRNQHNLKGLSLAQLGKKYNVSKGIIWGIVNNKTYLS